MNILVCVKQVPDMEENPAKLDPTTNTIVREGLPSIMSSFDAYALEAAARIKDERPDTRIIVLTLGPEQAKAVLRESLSICADAAYFVSDAVYAGSDALATGRILAHAIRRIEQLEGTGFTAVFCGRQSVDGETALVSSAIAETLGYPQISAALDVTYDGAEVSAVLESSDGLVGVRAETPCVVSVGKPEWATRFPTIKRKLAANRAVIPTLGSAELGEVEGVGLEGSHVRVVSVREPPKRAAGVIISEETDELSALKLAGILRRDSIV